ncbi:hypothetical protein DYQ86_22100 [Acidobacteria bacterium AB60]|nr:hypothetical protein DYQ86_22100 [Acidobacteria bacterium AB60]
MRIAITFVVIGVGACVGFAQSPAAAPANPLHREYREGQKLAYHMTGVNDGWHYAIDGDGAVTKDASGRFVEQFQWTHMTSEGQPVALTTPADYRQRLTLDPGVNPSAPDVRNVDPKMVGPVTDLMTFYVDLWLPSKLGVLKKAGDHFYFRNPMGPSSWADGKTVLVGEDLIDFDMTLKSVDAAAGTALVEVKHVGPQDGRLPLKADWMKTPVGSGANNWVEIRKDADGKYEAGVGSETFTVDITVSLADGHIVRGSMENPVITVSRVCEDEALTKCGELKRKEIVRKIEVGERR